MATIITKNSATAGNTPSNLTQGELAINVADGRLFYGSGSSSVVKQFDTIPTASHAENAGNASAIDIYSFSSPVDSYLLMSNVVATTGVAIGGDSDLRYNSSTNVLTVPNISATTLTGSLLGTAATASYLNTLNQNLTFNGNLTLNGTASISYLNVQYETASVIYSSGSNQFGDAPNDTQTLYGTVRIATGSLSLSGSVYISSSNFIRFDHTGSGTNTNYSDLSVYRYSTYDTPALKLIRPDGIGFNLYRQGSTNAVWLGDENGNRNMTMYSNVFGAFTFVAPGSGGDFSFTGGDATTPAYASSIVFKTNDYNINAVTSSDHSIKIQGPNVTGSNPYNLVSFQVGGTFAEKAAIRYDGGAYFSSSVGISTTSPSASLHILSPSSTLLKIDSPASSNIIYVTGSGNVGIGTSAPNAKLDVAGSIRTSTIVYTNNVYSKDASNTLLNLNGTTSVTLGLHNANMPFIIGVTGGSEIMRISGSGNVGIGTSIPTQKLHVSGGNALVNGTIYFGDGSHYLTTDNSTYALLSSNRNLQLGRSGVAALTVASTNNILIGTTTDSGYKFDVSGSGRFTNGLAVTSSLTISGSTIITGSLRVGVPGTNTAAIDTTIGTLSRGAITSIDWVNRSLNNSAGTLTVDWEGLALADSAGGASIDWAGRALYNSTGTNTLDWENLALYDSATFPSMDWNARYLYDSAGNRSQNYDARALIYPDGTSAALSYGTQGQVTINANTIITGSLTVGSASLGPSENTITLGARDAVNEGGQIGFNAPGGTYTSASMIDLYQNRLRVLRGTNAGSDAEVAWWSMHNKQMALPAYNSPAAFPGTAAASLFVDSSGQILTKALGAASTTIYAAHGNSTTAANSLSYTCYLGGTPVSITTATNAFGSAANAFMPGYPMAAPGTASSLIINMRTTGSALSAYRFYISNNNTSATGSVITMAAGHAAGVYSGSVGQVTFNEGNRLFFMISSTFVAGAGPSGQLTTATFKYTTD